MMGIVKACYVLMAVSGVFICPCSCARVNRHETSKTPDDAESKISDDAEPKISDDAESSKALDDASIISEWNDESMGIGLSAVGDDGWESGKWGFMDEPPEKYIEWAQSFVSILTRKQDMRLYQDRFFGIMFHITPTSDMWKYFQVIGTGRPGKNEVGNIVGGPGDGGSQTAPRADFRLTVQSEGKDYQWFQSQKDGILEKYNTVYPGSHPYNEFITNGLPRSAVAGILRYHPPEPGLTESKPTDEQMCNMLWWRERWPIYAYDRSSLKIERHLDCT